MLGKRIAKTVAMLAFREAHLLGAEGRSVLVFVPGREEGYAAEHAFHLAQSVQGTQPGNGLYSTIVIHEDNMNDKSIRRSMQG